MTLPLSIFIICCDEVERIGLVLESVKNLSDDIVIVDSGSTDGTLELVKKYTDRVYHKNWEGFGQQKVYGESLCRHDWILNLDADEILLDDIRKSIKHVFDTPETERAGAYSIRICHVSHLSKSKKPQLFCPVNITPRLYDKKRAGFKDSTVHDKLVVFNRGKMDVLKGRVAHLSLKSFAHMRKKIKSYSELQAQAWFEKGRKSSLLTLLYDPPAFFLKSYFLRRLCFVGYEGLMISLAITSGRTQRILLTRKKWAERSKEN
ncbi:MAG: glycosyltransferase family 2 protein [Alphaproteobacteria bacterium]|nr:glycosyltransferase family 2 protein [Alphaproteobacteria bacterium]